METPYDKTWYNTDRQFWVVKKNIKLNDFILKKFKYSILSIVKEVYCKNAADNVLKAKN